MDGGSSMAESTTSESISDAPASMMTTLPVLSKSSDGQSTPRSVVLDYEGGVEAESRKLPSSRFKGVVPQPNGRWGAQIYEKHQRVWLGTFNEEEEAAKVYDIAAQRFRGRDAVTNFKSASPTQESDFETAFLNSHSKAEIVDMLRKHTYNDELQQSKRNYQLLDRRWPEGSSPDLTPPSFDSDQSIEHLFEKTVTPSDVGKLNRLVIPKQYAEKHFPLHKENGTACKGILLNFEDGSRKVWRFRYSYWNSSQSYVLTKGWSRFVKEKNLKAGDIVSFRRSTGPDKQLYIEKKARNGSGAITNTDKVNPIQIVRLFGVNIVNVAVPVGEEFVKSNSGNCFRKTTRDEEFLAYDYCNKKQKIINALS